MASEKLKKALCEAAEKEFFDIEAARSSWTPSPELEEAMQRLFAREKAHRRIRVRYVLLAAALIVLLTATVVFGAADVRNRVIRFFVEREEDHYNMEYGYWEPGDIPVYDAISQIYEPETLPDGLRFKSRTTADHAVTTVWENGDETLILRQGDGLTKRLLDAERLAHSSLTVGERTVEVYTEENYVLLLWNTEQYTFSVDYYGELSASLLAEMVVGG